MTAALITGPAIEPVSLAEAKAHLRVEADADDTLIADAIAAARIHVEAVTRRALISQAWRIYLDRWPPARMVTLRPAPVLSVETVTVYDVEGAPTIVAPEDYSADLAAAPGRLRILPGARLPGRPLNGIEIDLTAGYGEAAGDVPAPLRRAILMLLAHWYDHREAVGFDGPGAVTPLGFEALVAPYRVLSL
jgi:uncharacterized phiE125 gp8 family phage protein